MNRLRVLSIFVLCILFPLVTFAQLGDQSDLFSWEVSLQKEEVQQGAVVDVVLDLEIAPDHYTYKDRTEFSIEAPEGIKAQEAEFPEALIKYDPFEEKDMAIYTDQVRYTIPLVIDADAPLGEQEITVSARYQGCSQEACFFPKTIPSTLTLEVIEGTGKPASAISAENQSGETEAASAGTTQTGNESFDRLLTGGSFFLYFGLFIAGFLTSLTPCVFPLIPITVSIFGARQAPNKLIAFSLAFTYVMGIAVMYSSLGFLAASTDLVFGQFMSNIWVVGFISLVFIALGFAMLGSFELQLPPSLQARLSQVGGQGYGSAFIMGLLAGVIAAPCTGPILFGLLTFIAKEATPIEGISMLFIYSLGLGTLFLVLGTFSGLITKIPRSGNWMEGVKSIFAILLFAFALYYLKDVFPFLREPLSFSVTTYVIATVMLITGIILGGIHLSFHSHKFSIKIRKALGVILCVFAIYIGYGSQYAVQASEELNWKHDIEEGLQIAEEENRPVMIDFYADWCTACKQLDAFTYSNQKVHEALKNYVNIKIDLTKETEENEEIKERFSIAGLPLVVFINSEGKRLPDKRITGFMGPEEFLAHIRDIE